MSLAPEHPSGWPRAVAPPFTLTRAIADLAGVCRRDHAVGLERRCEGGHLLPVHRDADTLVGVQHAPVRERHGDDLALEAPLSDAPPRLLVALGGELVQLLALEPPLLGDQLGGEPLGDDVVALGELRADGAVPRPLAVGAHGDPGHALDATR